MAAGFRDVTGFATVAKRLFYVLTALELLFLPVSLWIAAIGVEDAGDYFSNLAAAMSPEAVTGIVLCSWFTLSIACLSGYFAYLE